MNPKISDSDVRDIAKRIIQGNEKRKRRSRQHKASPFDVAVMEAINSAIRDICGNIVSREERKKMQDKIYKSIVYSIPYEYMGDVCCGRRRFYEYRNEFIFLVADKLGMIQEKKGKTREEGKN